MTAAHAVYFYVLGYDQDELPLAHAEISALTGAQLAHPRVAVANRFVQPERTAYVKDAAELIAEAATIDALAEALRAKKLAAERFRIHVVKIPGGLPLPSRRLATRIADEINGHPHLEHPAAHLLLLSTERGFWFGRQFPFPEHRWKRFQNKPRDFSSALPARLARAVVNLAAHPGQSIADPCCGSGTILLHAADLGMRATGWDINPRMVSMSRANLQHYALPGEVHLGDAATIQGRFDAVITNLPYGHFCAITPKEYRAILANCRRLAPTLTLITAADCQSLLTEVGYRIERTIRTGPRLAHRIIYTASQ